METTLSMDAAQRTNGRIMITVELVLYLGIAALALTLRLAELDTIPLTHTEAREALSAWRAVTPGASGEQITAGSALNFMAQSLSFTTLGGSEVTARLGTVLAGAALVLLPALFRDLLGVTRALIMSVLLLVSPVLLAASRLGSPSVWALLTAGVLLWAVWRFQQTRASSYGVIGAAALAALVLLSEPAGLVLALILGAAGIITVLTEPINEEDDEEPARDSWVRAFPWVGAGGAAALTVFIVSTAFLTYPAGLSAAGEAVGGALRGFFEGTPEVALLPAVVALFYEPFVVIFGVIGVILLARSGGMDALDRFLLAWVIMGVFASLVFVGAHPAHALWLTIPLAGLAAYTALRFISHTAEDAVFAVPVSARWMVAALMVALLFLATVPFQDVARAMVAANDLLSIAVDPTSWILLLLSVMFLIVGYLLFASLWDSRTAVRGIGLGLLIFGGVTSLGAGWNISVTAASDPIALWHQRPTDSDLFRLRETLIEVALREQVGFTARLPVFALAPENDALAWILRDFTDTRYITDLQDAATQPILILPQIAGELELGAPYVGQDFTVSRSLLGAERFNWLDLPAWWSQGRSRVQNVQQDEVVLWLRQDIYQGVPFSDGVSG